MTDHTSWKAFTVEHKDHVAQVTLIGPGKGNAMGPDFWSELPADLRRPRRRSRGARRRPRRLRQALLVRPRPAAMGGDLRAGPRGQGARAGRAPTSTTMIKRMQAAITAVADCRKPVDRGDPGLVHRRRRRPHHRGRHPLRQRRREVQRPRGEGRDRRGHRQPRPPARDHRRRAPARTRSHRQGHRRCARREDRPGQRRLRRRRRRPRRGARATAAEIAANPPLVVHGHQGRARPQRARRTSTTSLRYVAAWNAAFLPSRISAEAIKAIFEKRPPEFKGQ